MSVVERSFPFSPRSSRKLHLGDLIGAPVHDRQGTLSATSLHDASVRTSRDSNGDNAAMR